MDAQQSGKVVFATGSASGEVAKDQELDQTHNGEDDDDAQVWTRWKLK